MLNGDAEFFRIKASHSDLIDRAGGQKRAGGLIGLSQQMMSCVQDREHTALLSVRSKLVLERECGEPMATSVEADLLGCRLERAMLASLPGSALDAHAQVMAEVADVCRSVAQAWLDGKYTRADAATVDRDLTELARSIERFRRVNAATMAGGAA